MTSLLAHLATLIGTAWSVVVLVGARRFVERSPLDPARFDSLLGAGARSRNVDGADQPGLIERLGNAVRSRVVVLSDLSDRTVGWTLVLAPVAAIAFGAPALIGAAGFVVVNVLRRRRRAASAARTELAELARLADLTAMALRSGLPLASALERACLAAPTGATRSLAEELGRRRGVEAALLRWSAAGPDDRRSLAALLIAGVTSGGPVAERLERRSSAMQHRRRHELIAAARRLPVRLLFPLVCCTLPSFVALSVVPLVVVSLRGLTLS